jgi:formylglycine-generating enzyme required for sulfatase activity
MLIMIGRDLAIILAMLAAIQSPVSTNPTKVNSKDGLAYVGIRPGSYFTGCLPGDTECIGLERQRRKVQISTGFWIGRTEVTQLAYQRVTKTDPSFYRGADLPVDRVSWFDATKYCSLTGMRLPTESEWEYAAYGGMTQLPQEPLASVAWYDPNSSDRTHPVSEKLPNGHGLYDMLGNVWEWVADPGIGPGERLLKGGSFYNIARDVRVSNRLSAPPDLAYRDPGFRCAATSWPEPGS